jgi:hypothetical protein
MLLSELDDLNVNEEYIMLLIKIDDDYITLFDEVKKIFKETNPLGIYVVDENTYSKYILKVIGLLKNNGFTVDKFKEILIGASPLRINQIYKKINEKIIQDVRFNKILFTTENIKTGLE